MAEVLEHACPHCQGEGYVLFVGQPGDFSCDQEAFVPSESYELCEHCQGEGHIEVCAECLAPFEILKGKEVCACVKEGLAKAA